MKPTIANPNSLQSRGIESSVKFGIKASGLHHILGILRNQLYSDKVLAVIREYTCNAVDAHTVASKTNVPIEVSLPTKLNLLFKVRDFGPALSDEEIQDVYAFYGESTKRNTNDQIGMLGIGSKSAFAYGDNFVINSFINGKKSIYNAFIDPSQVGQISKIGEEDTNEKDGIEIVVPVREDDIQEFADKAKDLFKFYKVRPTVKGVPKFDYGDSNELFSGDTWAWYDCTTDRYSRNNHAIVVMGNIGYPISQHDLNLNYDDKISHLLTENLVLNVPIGDLEISASREKLQFTDYTRKQLKKHLDTVAEELTKIIGKEFGECKTLFEAKCLYGSTFRTDSPLYQLRDVIKKHLTWNGKLIDGNELTTYNSKGVEMRKFKKMHRSGKYQPEENSTAQLEKGSVIIENDIGHRRGLLGRILPLIINQDKTPHLIEFSDEWTTTNGNQAKMTAAKAKKAWIKAEEFDGELVKLSSLPKHKLSEFDGYGNVGNGSGSAYGVNKKHSATCFEYDWSFEGRNYHAKKSDFWEIASLDIENESGLFIIIDQFKPENRQSANGYYNDEPRSIKVLKDELEQVGVKLPKHVYAFKLKDRLKIEGKDGWTNLYEWVSRKLEGIISDDSLNQAWIDTQAVDTLEQNNEHCDRYDSPKMFESLAGKVLDGAVVKDGVFADFINKYLEMRQTKEIRGKIKGMRDLSERFGIDFKCPKEVKASYNLKKLLDGVMKKYSMIPLVGNWGYGFDERGSVEKVINYVNVIDLCGKESLNETHGS
jgi:hypothetical protein